VLSSSKARIARSAAPAPRFHAMRAKFQVR
jgi:hypothetical protein